MKKKKEILIGISVIIVLLISYLVPWFDLISFHFGIPPCIGRGCRVEGGGGGMELGIVYCKGYPGYLELDHFGLICFPDAESYCRYAHPFTFREKCLCESYKRVDISAFKKFCEKDKKCYTNSWEYGFGCAEDMRNVCKKAEGVFTSPDACTDWEGSALSYGLVKDGSECSKSWADIYMHGDETQKRNIFYKEFKDLCVLICENCKSDLCNEGNICEYAV